MFKKKDLKNPVSVIRTPDEINKEYSDIVLKLGTFSIQEADAAKQGKAISEAAKNIMAQKEKLIERVTELSQEMNESQQELERKKASQKSTEEPAPAGVLL